MSSYQLCFEFGLTLCLQQVSYQYQVYHKLTSLVVLIFCIMELMIVLLALVVCLCVKFVLECNHGVIRLGFWLSSCLVLHCQASVPLGLELLCSFWDNFLLWFGTWMDPVVRFYNLDRSGWHALIDLIGDTHTIVSYLFLE